MNLGAVIRLIMALVKVLKVNVIELSAAYSDGVACEVTFNEIAMLVNENSRTTTTIQ